MACNATTCTTCLALSDDCLWGYDYSISSGHCCYQGYCVTGYTIISSSDCSSSSDFSSIFSGTFIPFIVVFIILCIIGCYCTARHRAKQRMLQQARIVASAQPTLGVTMTIFPSNAAGQCMPTGVPVQQPQQYGYPPYAQFQQAGCPVPQQPGFQPQQPVYPPQPPACYGQQQQSYCAEQMQPCYQQPVQQIQQQYQPGQTQAPPPYGGQPVYQQQVPPSYAQQQNPLSYMQPQPNPEICVQEQNPPVYCQEKAIAQALQNDDCSQQKCQIDDERPPVKQPEGNTYAPEPADCQVSKRTDDELAKGGDCEKGTSDA